MGLVVAGGRVVDPANGRDEVVDLYIEGARIESIGVKPTGFRAQRCIDASGRVVGPGLVDLSARFREPGQEHKATIASECAAAAAAGITTVCNPPDTEPVVDTPAVVELIHQRAVAAGSARVEILGALTHGLKGERLAEMGALRSAGCVGVSNGLAPVVNTEVMRRALEYAGTFALTVFVHAEDSWLAEGRLVHDGEIGTRLGLSGIPSVAESTIVARELLLAEQTGARIHFSHLSTEGAVTLVEAAKARKLPVSADVAMHQLYLTETDVAEFDSQFHVRPPLRSERDRQALRRGIGEGIIDAICSDHQPHELDAKQNPFAETEPGISGLETLLSLGLGLVDSGLLDLNTLIQRLSAAPATILGLDRGRLGAGDPADLFVLDPLASWTVDPGRFVSRGHNTPFSGRTMMGKISHTLLNGQVVYEAEPNGGPK